MIAAIEGTLDFRGDSWAIIKVGGVSLQVHTPASTLSQLGAVGERVQLYTHFHLREDNIALYGFTSKQEVDLFKMLIGVDGVGPKVALAILSALSPEQLALAIASGNIDMLTQLPGVGKKTAQRLVLELKGKLDKEWAGVEKPYLGEDSAEIMAALTNLGYSAAEASRAIAALSPASDLALEDKIKLALQYLAPARVAGG
jgi:Holliday junction DNA helicase RuvA